MNLLLNMNTSQFLYTRLFYLHDVGACTNINSDDKINCIVTNIQCTFECLKLDICFCSFDCCIRDIHYSQHFHKSRESMPEGGVNSIISFTKMFLFNII